MLCFLGGGRMAQALLGGLVASGRAVDTLRVADPLPEARAGCARLLPEESIFSDNAAMLRTASPLTVVLAVKPQQAAAVLPELSAAGTNLELVVSVAAGITTSRLEKALGETAVVRAMPNTPALIRCGVTALAAGRHARPEHLRTAREIFATVGEVIEVAEKEMDAVTAISGSGPAYFFLMMQELEANAIAHGLSAEHARILVIQTARGASRLASESSSPDFSGMIAAVASKGGTTEAALKVLHEDFRRLFAAAIKAAHRRAGELGRLSE